MLLLIKNVDVYSPEARGRLDLLVGSPEAGGRILALAPNLDPRGWPLPCEVRDGSGLVAVPGLIDNHVHLIGGGGEGGWATRTPELTLTDATLAGVTTVVGVLGTDGVTRTMEALVAKVYSLREEGISAWCHTGSYRFPPATLTGDAMRDLMLIDAVIGIGETALSDHRSSKPTTDELARLASEARVGGMLSGKAGIVNFHLGEAPEGLGPLRSLVARGDLPPTQFLPTHCSRSQKVYRESLEWAREGGYIDFTTSTVQAFLDQGEISAGQALAQARSEGIPVDRMTFSSDGQGSLPLFDAQGVLQGLTVGTCASLLEAVREAVSLGVPLEEALRTVTSTPAGILKLPRKGRLAPGYDADVTLLSPGTLAVHTVLAGGKVMVEQGKPTRKGFIAS